MAGRGKDRARTILGALCLLGIMALVIGLFLPWIDLINVPDSGTTPYWKIILSFVSIPIGSDQNIGLFFLLIGLSGSLPIVLVALTNVFVAIAAWRGRSVRVWAGIGLPFAGAALAFFLFWSTIAEVLTGNAACEACGAPALSDYFALSTGFCVMLVGLLMFLVCDIALLIVGSPMAQTKTDSDSEAL